MLILQFRANGQRSEEPKTAPVRCEIRPSKMTINLSYQGCTRIGPPAREHVLSVSPEIFGIGYTNECAECYSKDPTRFNKIRFQHRTNKTVSCSLALR